MSGFPFDPPPKTTLPIVGSELRFPVNRVYCVGRNYAAHVIEMGNDPNRGTPFFFQKNASNLDSSGFFPYPDKTTEVHHEVELAVVLQSGGSNISVAEALDHVYGYAPSLDMTRRDVQAEQKKLGRPWEISKAFERSAPIGPIHPVTEVGQLREGRVSLRVNGVVRQEGDLNQLIWKIPELISYLSEYFELAGGDVILTGTPSGVSSVQRGDIMEAKIAGLNVMRIKVV